MGSKPVARWALVFPIFGTVSHVYFFSSQVKAREVVPRFSFMAPWDLKPAQPFIDYSSPRELEVNPSPERVRQAVKRARETSNVKDTGFCPRWIEETADGKETT